jgi:hypothetical protein
MTRFIPAAAIAALVLGAGTTYAQSPVRGERSAFPAGSIEGQVLDDKQGPIAGAMVSVVGRATAVAATDRDGRFALRELPFGPYILSVHSRGYWKSRGRTIQLTAKKVSVPEILLIRFTSDKVPALTPAVGHPTQAVPTQLAGFGIDLPMIPEVAAAQPTASTAATSSESEDEGETAWRLRHLPRSILKEVKTDGVWTDNISSFGPVSWLGRGAGVVTPIAFFSELPLSGQVNLMTIESFDRPGRLFATDSARNVAFISVNTQAAGGAWAMQGAMTQGDLSSWIVAGSYKSIESANHAYDLGLSYSTQRYEGGNVAALAAIRDNTRNVGTVYGYDQWTVSPRLVLGYGTGYARYDYLGGSGLWSPRLSLTVPIDGFRLKALVSQRAVVPGAEEFAPSITGLWLPPERTFSSLAADGAFRPEHTRHMQVSVERDLAAGVTVSLRGFGQRVEDQLVEVFGVDLPGRPETPLGHYLVGTAGDIEARGWGIGMVQEVPGYLRGSVEYTVTTAYWLASDTTFGRGAHSSGLASSENVYDLQTAVEATIPQTSTRIYARYRMNTAFWSDAADVLAIARPNANTRFNVRVNQSLPFMRFSNADWEMLVDVRNMFREADSEASLYDEALAIRAPKRIVGGLLVKF